MTAVISAILEFSPERLTTPGVIVGLVLMVVGLVAVLASGVIADMFPKKEESPDFRRNVVRICGAVVLLAGGITAVLCA